MLGLKGEKWARFYRRLRSGRLLALSYMLTIAAGTLLLMLPWSVEGEALSLVDALFTSSSAVCVTGLTVVDTGTTFSVFGKIILLALIQVGGLGIMTFTVLMFLTAGRLPALRDRWVIENMYSGQGQVQLLSLIRTIFLFTLFAEILGATCLFAGWLSEGFAPGEALWYGVFHSVSAFCNAGFAFFPDSMERFVGNWYINLSICGLIVSGGLGFAVMYELFGRFRVRSARRLSLHTRLVLVTTVFLIAAGAAAFLLLEANNTLTTLSAPERFMAGLFQSVTARTAGFNTIGMAGLSNGMLLVLIVLMFIGASPGSCGGGVRTTSLALLVAFFGNRVRGNRNINIWGRTVPEDTINKVVLVILLGVLAVVGVTLLLLVSQSEVVSHPLQRDLFLSYLFEAVSALGTVGLSLGVTPTLDHTGKILIVLLMFIGRVGLPTLAYGLLRRERKVSIEYANEDVMI